MVEAADRGHKMWSSMISVTGDSLREMVSRKVKEDVITEFKVTVSIT